MAETIQFDPSSWRRAADRFHDSATRSVDLITQLVSDTTNPATCNAANGLSTVDGAISTMLEVFGQVMTEHVITPYAHGIDSEAETMRAAAASYEEVENNNTHTDAQVALMFTEGS